VGVSGGGMAMQVAPLVSCVMPTANRRRFVPTAISLFLAQGYPNKELIILDDGDDPVEDLVPHAAGLRYIRTPSRRTLGAKRNAACAAAAGDIIVHWDDDDWYGPQRIEYQVAALLNDGADLCGIDRVLFMDPTARQAWEYVYPAGATPWVCGATLCYRKELWRAHPFADVGIGEDTRFVAAARGARVRVLDDNRFFVGLVHAANTSPKRTRDGRWEPRAFDAVRAIAGPEWPATARSPTPLPATLKGRTALVAAAAGIGDILRATPLIRALHRLGYAVDVLLAPDCAEVVDLLRGAPEIRRLFVTADVTHRHAAPPVPELLGTAYDAAAFTAWSAPLARQVKAGRQFSVARARWLTEGDSASVARIAHELGWHGAMPEPFAMSSGRNFDLAPGTVALHPGCKPGWPWKRWHGFAELARRFAHVVVIGTEADLDNAGTYFGTRFIWPEHARSFVGQLSLFDTAALIRQCAALVANDSGLMHLGAALGVPTFGLFGLTSPAREAMPSRFMVPVSKHLACEPGCRENPWGRRDCEHHLECLKMLTPDDVMERMAEARELPAVARAPAKDTVHVAYHAAVFDASGYGAAARAYVRALHEAGVRVSVIDSGAQPGQMQDPLCRSLLDAGADADFHVFHGIPPFWAREAYRFRNVIAMTVWETDTMPPSWRNPLTHALDVWLPCRFNADVFARALGRETFRLPHPLPHRHEGGDAIDFTALGIRESDFLFYGCFEWQDRKNPAGLIEAFLRAFPRGDGAVLLIKTGASAAALARRALHAARERLGSAGRIVLCAEAWSEAKIAALHARGDCYVSLHKGEGWAYPLFEAAGLGKPVLATAYSGPLDYLDAKHHWLVRARPAPVAQPYAYYHPSMRWAEPDLEHAIEGMRWIATHRAAAREAATRAATRLQEEFSAERIGIAAKARLLELLAKSDRARAQAVVAHERRRHAPQGPIPGAWYDADYFEHGQTSNWQQGYTWPLFRGVFTDAAAYLAEMFPEARSFLDVGCAKGFLVRALRERGLEAEGFDHSPWAIEHAESAARPHLRLADADTVAFDRRFDLTVAMSVLESLTEEQLRRLLPRARGWTTQALLAVIETRHDAKDRDLSHITIRDRAWWRALFRETGWQQDPMHRSFERACQAHPVAVRMGWNVHVFAPGH
jgi:ADP-heptose:LPS heptosyltransferase/glycosyltransferase involved in cell wall biosynthesis/SAM-dependent methyltransferase